MPDAAIVGAVLDENQEAHGCRLVNAVTSMPEASPPGVQDDPVADDADRGVLELARSRRCPQALIQRLLSIVPVEEIERRRDPTWEHDVFEWLIPMQERFWSQMARIRPISYVAMGEQDIVVTRSPTFASMLGVAG